MLRSVGQVQADLLCEAGDGSHGMLALALATFGYRPCISPPVPSPFYGLIDDASSNPAGCIA